MAEVPPYLLERSRARRAALGLGAEGDTGAAVAGNPAPVPAGGVSPAVPVGAAATTTDAGVAAGGSGRGAKAGAPTPYIAPPPRGSSVAKIGSVFFLLAVPLWAVFMFNAYATQRSLVQSPAEIGAAIYASSNCVTCHLSNGAGKEGGGVGRPLYNGNAEKTFPDPLQQVAFVKHGSCGVGTPYGNPNREGGQHKAIGGMPAFASTLTDQEILYVIQYERSVLSNKPYPADLLAKAGEAPNPARIPAVGAPTTTIAPVATDKICG